MKRTLILSAAALILIVASLVYFLHLRPNQSQIEPKTAAQNQLEQQPATRFIAAPGVVEAVSEEIEVGAEIAGKLKTVFVEEGDKVVKNQIVAVLENSNFEAQIRSAKANIETIRRQKETAQARLSQAKADRERIANGSRREERSEAKAIFEQTLPTLENAKREFERRQKLYDSGDVSREEFDRARTAFENAQKQSLAQRERFNVVNADARADDLEKADAAIRLAAAQIKEFDALIIEAEAKARESEANLTKTVVRAPISGIVLRKRLKTGESVSPENPIGIVTVADTSALRVRVDLDETDVARIRENQAAYVTADAFGERKFAAKVVRVGQILGRKNFRTDRPTEKIDTKILEVLLELAPDQRLPLGLRVDAFIRADSF